MSAKKSKNEKQASFQHVSEQKELWEEEWENMPEYSNEEVEMYKTIKIHFKTKKDYDKFARIISQALTEKTKSIWYPKLVKGLFSKLRYSDES